MLVWLSVWSKVQIVCIWSIPKPHHLLPHFKSRLVLPFWYRLTQAVLEKRLLNGCVVAVLSKKNNDHQIPHDADDADHNNQHITWVLYAKLQSCLDDKEQQMQTVDDSYAACHKNLLTIFQAHHRMLK